MERFKNHLVSHPYISVIYLLFVCLVFRIIDIFVLRMDEKIGEIILSKTLGLILIVLFIKFIGKSLSYIYMHKENLKASVIISITQVIVALIITFGVRYLYILINDGEPYFAFSNQYTIITLVSFVVIGNIINTLMEEGLFRGIIFKALLTKTSFIKANLIQAIIFGLWHITWTIKEYLLGKVTIGEFLINSILYILIATIMGFIMGYMIYKTKSIWTPVIWHTIWNITMNVLIIKSNIYNDESNIMTNSYTIFWLAFLMYSIIAVFILRKVTHKQYIKE